MLNGKREVTFRIGKYDARKPLVIDPVLSYSTYLGGSSFDRAHAIAVDGDGNAYVTGRAESIDFPTANAFQPACGGAPGPCMGDAFVTKLNADGSALVYSTYLGGYSSDEGTAIAVDSGGSAYIAGYTTSLDFPTVNPLQPGLRGYMNAFVSKLSPDGSSLLYSTYLGGTDGDLARGIAVDTGANAYITGQTSSRDFPTANALQPACGGPPGPCLGDAFVTKLNADGSALVYSTYLGGTAFDGGNGIAVDAAGNAFVTGRTDSADFPTANALQPACGEAPGRCSDAFVTKLNRDGSALVYSTYLGGSNTDVAHGIAVDAAGNAYVTGETFSFDFPTRIPLQQTIDRAFDAFITKLNPAGSALIYSTYFGGNGEDAGLAVAADADGNAYVAGVTSSLNFLSARALQERFGGGFYDAFVLKLTAGGSLVYSSYLGGSDIDEGQGIAVDVNGNAYVAGYTQSPNFPVANPFQPTIRGRQNALLTKIASPSIASAQTVFLVHGIDQRGGEDGDLRRLAANLRASLPENRFIVDAGFDWQRCAIHCESGCTLDGTEDSPPGRNGPKALAEYIAGRQPIGDIIIIGFSMGGLLARDMVLNQLADYRVAALVTLGTPNLGYPRELQDPIFTCGPLANAMFGDFRSPPIFPGEELLIDDDDPPHTVTVSRYLAALNIRWWSAPRDRLPNVWLAAAGTFCLNDIRLDSPLARGCSPQVPRNDGIVCDQSASFEQWNVVRNGPTYRWDDDRLHEYGHRDSSFSLFCEFRSPLSLSNPPSDGTLMMRILDLINGLPMSRPY